MVVLKNLATGQIFKIVFNSGYQHLFKRFTSSGLKIRSFDRTTIPSDSRTPLNYCWTVEKYTRITKHCPLSADETYMSVRGRSFSQQLGAANFKDISRGQKK